MIEQLKFQFFDSDICFFKYNTKSVFIVLYINDLLISVFTVKTIYKIYDKLSKYFIFKNIRFVKRFLSFDIVCNCENRTVFLL